MLLSKKIPFLSVCTVLGVLFLLFGAYIPTNTIFFTLFASVFVMLGLYEYKISGGILTYVAISLLSFFLVFNKVVLVWFVLFFGYYPIIKAFIEKLNNLVLEWLLKLTVGGIAFFGIYKIFTVAFLDAKIKLPLLILTVVAIIVFIIYDIALSIFINFYESRIRPYIKGGNR